jgi:hypothetical protein
VVRARRPQCAPGEGEGLISTGSRESNEQNGFAGPIAKSVRHPFSSRSGYRDVSRSQPSEVNHDERYDAWNDVGRGLVWLLIIIVLILAAAALVKYLRSTNGGDRR